MRAAIKILDHNKSEDYIISSNQQIRILDIIKYIFAKFKLSTVRHLKIDKKLILRKSNNLLVGNNNFLKKKIKWKKQYNYKQMIDRILKIKTHG